MSVASSRSPSPDTMSALLTSPSPPKTSIAITVLNSKIAELEAANKRLDAINTRQMEKIVELEEEYAEIFQELETLKKASLAKAETEVISDGSVIRINGISGKKNKCFYMEEAAKYKHTFRAGSHIMGVDVSQRPNSKNYTKIGEYFFEYIDKKTLRGLDDKKIYPHQGGRVNFINDAGRHIRMKLMYGMEDI